MILQEKMNEIGTTDFSDRESNNINDNTNNNDNSLNIVKNDNPSILHLLAHKAQLDLYVNQYVDNYFFSKAKFPLSDNQSKLL